jgi:hypothetical protein
MIIIFGLKKIVSSLFQKFMWCLLGIRCFHSKFIRWICSFVFWVSDSMVGVGVWYSDSWILVVCEWEWFWCCCFILGENEVFYSLLEFYSWGLGSAFWGSWKLNKIGRCLSEVYASKRGDSPHWYFFSWFSLLIQEEWYGNFLDLFLFIPLAW